LKRLSFFKVGIGNYGNQTQTKSYLEACGFKVYKIKQIHKWEAEGKKYDGTEDDLF
jgi:hypothetical protein